MNRMLRSLFFAVVLFISSSYAVTRTWNGGGADNNFSTVLNWGGTAPVAGDDLVFGGSTRLTPNNDIAAATSFNTITFAAGADTFTVGGNSIVIAAAGSITNSSANTETITFNINSSNDYTVTGSSGSIVLSGAVSFTGNHMLSKTGTCALTLSGTADNANLTVTATAGTIVLGKTSSSSVHATGLGATGSIINGGTVKLGGTGNSQNYRGNEWTINSGTYDLNGISDSIDIITGSGGFVDNSSATAATLTIGGQWDPNGTYSGVIENTVGVLSLVKRGAATWTLAGTNTFTGAVTVSAGTLKVGNTAAFGTSAGGVSVISGAVIDLNGTNYATAEPLTLNGTGISSGGALINSSATGATFAGLLTLGSVSSILSGTGTIAISNVGTITGATFGLTLGGAQGGTLTSILGTTSGTLTKQDAGTWTLAGVNTYTGATTVSAGTLSVTGSTHASSAVTVSSGATLAGTGTVNGLVTVNSGAILSPGVSSAGTLNTGTLVINSGGVLNYTLGTSSNKIALTGNLVLDGTLNVTAGTGFGPGTYTLMTYSGFATDHVLDLGTFPTGYSGNIGISNGVVSLYVYDFTGWGYSSRINFNTTSTGANVTTAQTNFPMLIRLDSNNFFFNQAQPTGADIRFIDPDGTTLSYEIDRWDATNKKAEVWVKVPQVDGNSNSDFITMYWGNSKAASQSSASGVFSSDAVRYHLKESPGGGAPQFPDASGNSNNGTAQNGASTDTLTSNIGLGFKLNGSNKYVSTTTSIVQPTTFTAGCWFKTTTLAGGRILGFGDFQTGQSNNYDRHLYMTNSGTLIWGIYNGSVITVTSSSTYNDGAWHYAVGRLSTNGIALYVDGALIGTNGANNPNSITGYWRLGYDNLNTWTSQPSSYYFNGTIDEFSVRNTELSADWIKLVYATQKQNQITVSFPNTALSTFGYNTKVYVNTTSSGANITTDVTNFPMLVRLTTANFNFTQARSDGNDLRFADSTGALLSYEVERFDATNKLADIWVLIPTVKANNNSQFFKMYWGKSSVTSLSSGPAVFTLANNYSGVWHLHNANYADATGNYSAGTNTATTTGTGIIAQGRTFDGTNGYVDLGGASTGLTAHPSTALTMEYWAYASAYPSGGGEMVVKASGAGSPTIEYAIELDGSNHPQMGIKTTSYDTDTYLPATTVMALSTWYHIVGTYDGSNSNVYINGNLENTLSMNGTINDYGNSLLLGKWQYGSTKMWNGIIDEPRISTSARSADFIRLEYETQKAASTVVQVGARSQDYTNSLRLNFNTTNTGANITGSNVTNIPILVRLTSSNFDFSKTTATGTDIKFIDKDGSNLYHEVVEWDKANYTGKVWVKVPQVDKNSTTDFVTLYYGCLTCAANPYAVSDSVWSAYKGVWHLNGGNENQAKDATHYANHLTYANAQANNTGLTTPQAPYFSGSSTKVTNPAGGELNMGTGDMTLSGWFKTTQAATASAYPFMAGKNSPSVIPRFGYGLATLATAGGNGGKAYFECWSNNVQKMTPISSSAVNDGLWHFITGKRASGTIELYVDGVSLGTTASAGAIVDNSESFVVAGSGDDIATNFFNGNANDVSLSTTAFSADYIKLSYENQKATSTFINSFTLSSTSFQNSKVFRLNTTASGANIAGDVYNFPLLLRIVAPDLGLLSNVQTGAPDIRFLSGDGVTWLDYSIERWSTATSPDSAEVWVKVPKISGNSSSEFITMYYQQASNVTVPDGQCATCVFDGVNANGVWHMDDNAASATVTDVRGSLNGTLKQSGSSRNTSSNTSQGYIGASSLSFNGSSEAVDFGSSVALGKNVSGVTISAWVKPSALPGSNGDFVFMSVNGSTTLERAKMNLNNSGYLIGGGRSTDAQSTYTLTATSNAMSTGTWYNVVTVNDYKGDSTRLYVNGARCTPLNSAGWAAKLSANTTGSMAFGARSDLTTDWYSGLIDEVQISSVAQDSNYIKLLYQNQSRNSLLFNPSIADFQNSQKIIFNTTKTGANVMDSVTNIPILLRLTAADGGNLSLVQSGAPDVRVLDGDGKTWLNYKIERWSTATSPDSAEIWVNVPKVDGNSDHDFVTVYYQQASGVTVTDGQCGSCVFSTSNGYQGVWNLSEETAGTGTASVYKDQTGNANHGTDYISSTTQTGQVGAGHTFNGTSDYISVPDAASLKPAASAITVGAWVNFNGLTGTSQGGSPNTDQYIIFKKNSRVGAFEGYNLYKYGSNLSFLTRNSSGTGNNVNSTTTVSTGTWYYVVGTYDGANSRIYVNGQLEATTANTNALDYGTNPIYLGRSGESWDTYFNGIMDQATVSSVVRDSNWIKLEYQNQRLTGNVFFNSRTSPNNLVTLTATATPATGSNTISNNNISLSWNTPVSDSTNADSVGIWVKYTGYPDSANMATVTKVIALAKTDSVYTYPATYPGTYYFALAVRNSSGVWSPFTKASSDTAVLAGVTTLTDTVYVDAAMGSNSNTCTQARSPFTPKLTITNAMANCYNNSINDTLVIRVMPGTYTDNDLAPPNTTPHTIVSFDRNNKAILAGAGSVSDGSTKYATVFVRGYVSLQNMDIRCATNTYNAIYIPSGNSNIRIEGNRIYNGSGAVHTNGINFTNANITNVHIANNLIYQPSQDGIYTTTDNAFNIVNNVFIGNATSTYAGINMAVTAGATDMTFTNNIFYNWDYGIKTTSASIGTCSNNLFYLVGTGHEVSGAITSNNVIKDPLFASTTVLNPNAFKILPGSPAIDAGTTTFAGGAAACAYRSVTDAFGTTRYLGTAPDIGRYEGTGYTANPQGDFDTLIASYNSTTVTVENSKWKLIWDAANGSGINWFSDKTVPATNLLLSNPVLFDVKIGSVTASTGTNTIPPTIFEASKTRVIVRQRVAISATIDLNIYYSVYASGHIFIQSEIANLANAATNLTTLDYKLKLASTNGAYTNGGTTKGFCYLTTATRDAVIAVTSDLDGGAATAETWTQTATSGTPGTVVFATANASAMARYMKRSQFFALYIGDQNIDFTKAATVNTDVYNPSVITTSAGSLLFERSWQDQLLSHWTMDDGAGAVARDKAVYYSNNAALSGANYKWVSGKVGGGLYLTQTDVGVVTNTATLDAAVSRSYMFWIKPDFAAMNSSGTTGFILSKGITPSSGWYFRKVSALKQIEFYMGNVSVTSPTLTDSVWTHIAVLVRNTSTLEMYVNGVLVSVSTGSVTATSNTTDIHIGENNGGSANNCFKGTLDDIRIFGNELNIGELESIYNRGFSNKYGHYALRADNNNRVIALINGGAAQTRMNPAFQISNWFSTKTPKYVYLNGIRLKPNTDFVVDSVNMTYSGAKLVLQLNKTLTSADQTLFIDDDDSTGFMGDASKMKSLTISSDANKIVIKNFSDTVFGSATSGQWYLEMDLRGWTTPTASHAADSGFGEFSSWKAAAVSPYVAISNATQLAALTPTAGRTIMGMRLDIGNPNNDMYSGGVGYASPGTITYTLTDSSATRISFVLSTMTYSGDGALTVKKRYTVYPTGRIFSSFEITTSNLSLTDARVDFGGRYNSNLPTNAWSTTYSQNNARIGLMGGDLDFHSFVGGLLSIKNNNAYAGTAAAMENGASVTTANTSNADMNQTHLALLSGMVKNTDAPITVNFAMDISKDFTDSATADSLMNDIQTPATITAISGTANPTDTMDFKGTAPINTVDGFAEGEGCYVYTAAGTGIAHFKFVNTVPAFNPAFRIKSWTFGTLPEYVILDNQSLTLGYQYNAYLKTGTNEIVIQLNKTLAIGTHVIYISHKNGLAVTLTSFEAKGGDGVDTLTWITQSEFENLGYNVWRRLADTTKAGTANLAHAAAVAAATAAAGTAGASVGSTNKNGVVGGKVKSNTDTLPAMVMNDRELAAEGYAKITAKLIPGADGGASATTKNYLFIDKTAAFDVGYEYLLEAVDFNGGRQQFGPRYAMPKNPLITELYPNYPNPFNPITTLHFSIKEKSKVTLVIYDGTGRVVRTLLRSEKPMLPGNYRLIWDAKNEGGLEVPSGQYFYRFTAAQYNKTRKMVLVK